MTTYTMSKCKVTFAQCSGNSVVSSYTVCTTLLNSEDVPTMRSISISQIVVLPDITDVIVLSISQFFLCLRQFPHFTEVSPTIHTFSGIRPMIAQLCPRSQPWRGVFSSRVVLNAFLERICCFCSVFLT